jgi:hypothetical protein
MAAYSYADEKARKQAAGIPLNNGVKATTTPAKPTSTGGMSQAQIDAEIRRKANEGIALNKPTADRQAMYDEVRGNLTNEVYRKADNGIPLAGSSGYNQSLYDARLAANKQPEVNASAMGTGSGNAGTPQSFIDQLNNSRLNATLAALGKSRDAALSNLGAEKGAIAPKYYDQRNQVAAGAQQQARNFAEFMAARGGTSSGANAQAELSRNMTTQGNLGTLGRQEAQAFTDIERRTSDLQNAYQSDVAGATAGVEADRMQAMLQDYYNEQQRQLQIAGLTGVYNDQKTLGGRSADLAQQQFQYGQTRDTIGDSQWQQQFDLNKQLNERDYNYQVGRDDIADSQWAQQFKEEVNQNGVQNALARVKASSSGSGGTKGLSLAQKISIWKISGEAPEGIPGVTPGAKVYDEVAARKAAEKSGGVKLWDAIKGVLGSVNNAAGNASGGASDADINQYLK